MKPAVEVWWVATSAAPDDDALLPVFDADERARLASYQEPRAARMFAVGAALVRCLAARELGSAPGDVVVDRTCRDCGKPHGRPVLTEPTTGRGLQVSVSHSGGLVGVAVARHPIGLDVEAATGARTCFPSPARSCPRWSWTPWRAPGLGEDPEHLLLWWTRKEAVLKLLGTGLRQQPTPCRCASTAMRSTSRPRAAGRSVWGCAG